MYLAILPGLSNLLEYESAFGKAGGTENIWEICRIFNWMMVMESLKIQDMKRGLRRLGILSITIGLVGIGVNLVMLMLTPGTEPGYPSYSFRVLGSLISTIVLFQGALCLISAQSLARRTDLSAPTRFSSWFTKKRNFILIILLTFLLTLVILLTVRP